MSGMVATIGQAMGDPAAQVALGGFLLCLTLTLAVRITFARHDPQSVPVRIQDLSGGARRHIRGHPLGRQSFAAALNDMAERRYLTIEQTPKGLQLRKAEGKAKLLPKAEQDLGNALLRIRSSLTLSEKSEKLLSNAHQAFVKGVHREVDEALNRPVRWRLFGAGLVAVLTSAVVSWLSADPLLTALLTFGGGVGVTAGVIMTYRLPRLWAARRHGLGRLPLYVTIVGVSLIAAALWSIFIRSDAGGPNPSVMFSILAFMVAAWSYEAIKANRCKIARRSLAAFDATAQDAGVRLAQPPGRAFYLDLSAQLNRTGTSADTGKTIEP